MGRISTEMGYDGIYTHDKTEEGMRDESDNDVNNKGRAAVIAAIASNDTCIPAQDEYGNRQQRESNEPGQIDIDIVRSPKLVQSAQTASAFVRRDLDVPGSFAVFARGDLPRLVLDASEGGGEELVRFELPLLRTQRGGDELAHALLGEQGGPQAPLDRVVDVGVLQGPFHEPICWRGGDLRW